MGLRNVIIQCDLLGHFKRHYLVELSPKPVQMPERFSESHGYAVSPFTNNYSNKMEPLTLIHLHGQTNLSKKIFFLDKRKVVEVWVFPMPALS